MKIKLTTLLLAAITLLATTATSFAQKKDIKISESSIKWRGNKVTGSHTGTLSFSSGFITLEKDNIKGGEFIVDMTTLTVTDLEAGKGKEKLEGHLNSDDFFGTKSHKTAKLILTKSEKTKTGYSLTGDITIKGKTEAITFDFTVNGDTITTTLKIDRTKFDIKYGSGSFFENLGDKAISNEFELAIDLKM